MSLIAKEKPVEQETEEVLNEIIIYKGSEAEPLITVSQFADIEFNLNNLEEINSPISKVLAPLAQQIPALGNNIKNSSQKLFKVVVDKSLAKGMIDGTLDLANSKELAGAYRGTIINTKTGKIVGQGNLKPIPQINPAAIVTGAFQVLSVITAQKFLADIDKKLGTILQHVEQLKRYFQNEWYGKIVGNIKYLGGVVKKTESGVVNEDEEKVILNTLEHSKRESLQLFEALNRNRIDHLNILINKDYNGRTLKKNSNGLKIDINKYFDYTTLTDNLLLYLISLNTGKNLFSNKKQSIKYDNDEIIIKIKEYKAHLDIEKNEIKKKAGSIKGHRIFSLDKTKKRYQNDLIAFCNSRNSVNDNTIDELNVLTDRVNTKLNELISSDSNNELLIEVDDNYNISKTYALKNTEKNQS